ncbi:hypothetical protein [Ectopseudomonas toyotomiensis]|nr:hypothetical protein [Pseudomonas toyotomiensis]
MVSLAVKMLFTQYAFLLKTKAQVKLDGALVISQGLPAEFMHADLGKGVL